jgi:hypothetical protein
MSDLVINSPTAELSEPRTAATTIRTACPQCSETLDHSDNFCRYCGAMTAAGAAMARNGRLRRPASLPIAAKLPGWTENPVVVVLGLFVVLGPLALPMLWRSRRFTRGWKIGLTVAVLLETAVFCWYVGEVWQKTVGEYNKSLEEYQRLGLF